MSDIADLTFDLVHRGKSTALWVDLFDEARYGADKLFFRGRFETFDDIKAQVEAALDTSYATSGGGNPLVKNATSGIAMNRYTAQEEKDILKTEGDPLPYKAKYAVHFRIRLKFHGDYAYIDFGKKWNKFGSEDYPIEETYVENGLTINDLELLECSVISPEDAKIVLTKFLPKYQS